MNYYGRRRYYRRRYPYRSSRRAYSTSSRSKRRAIGNQRAANQQKDTSQVNLSIQHKCSTEYYHNSLEILDNEGAGTGVYENFQSGVYALNIWDLLRKSEFYQSYATMYDQVRIDAIKLKLTPIAWNIQAPENQGLDGRIDYSIGTQYKAITVVTAWDRTGLSQEQVRIVAREVPIEGGNTGVIGLDANSDGLYVTMNDDVGTYSSAITTSLTFGSKSTINRYLYPSNLAEKSFYVNTADLKQWYEKYDQEKGRFIGFVDKDQVIQTAGNEDLDQGNLIAMLRNSPASESNPAFLLEDSTVPFKPTLLIGVQSPYPKSAFERTNANVIVQAPVTFNVEADIAVTFRGLRKARMVE